VFFFSREWHCGRVCPRVAPSLTRGVCKTSQRQAVVPAQDQLAGRNPAKTTKSVSRHHPLEERPYGATQRTSILLRKILC
jgi:hypothetical protein